MMKELLEQYYEVRCENDRLKNIVSKLQDELKRVKENYDYIVEMSQGYKDITDDEKQAELREALESVEDAVVLNHKVVTPKYNVGGGAVPKWGLVDYEYDTGHVVPRDDSHNWG
jgi:predicted nuclease with TOPRIM domain